MRIRVVGAEVLYVDGQTDGQTETDRLMDRQRRTETDRHGIDNSCFRYFTYAPKKR